MTSKELTRERRAAAAYTPIMEKRNPIPERRRFAGYDRNGGAIEEIEATGEVNCARCARIGGFDAEGQRGFCCWLRIMVSTWHPARCKAFASA